MAKSVIMPSLGMSQETGKIISWLKREGDWVEKGEMLLEVETDKVSVEIESTASGTLSNITAVAGDVIPVGETIATILARGEGLPDVKPIAREPGSGPSRTDDQEAISELQRTEASRKEPDRGTVPSKTRLPPASPKARRLAKELGVELSMVAGSGPEGAIVARDLSILADSQPELPKEDPEEKGKSDLPQQRETLELSRNWKVMAERLTKGWSSTPHFYLRREVKLSELIRWREEINSRASIKVTFTDMLVRVIASCLSRHPQLNASWRDGSIQLNRDVNVGIAVGLKDGLVVPVVQNANRLTFIQIAQARTDLVERAKLGRLTVEDQHDGTFTLTNLGMYGIDSFDPVVNPPQAAILGVGRMIDKLVLIDEKVVNQPVWNLTLSCDHRVVDGVRGAEFVQSLVELIEDPIRLMIYP